MRKEQPKIIVNTKQEAIEIVSECGAQLRRLENVWKKDRDVVLAAIQSFPFALAYADKTLRDDVKTVLAAVQLEPRVLTEASKRLSSNPQMRHYAFKLNGIPFIVDKTAFAEFQFWDAKLIASCTRYIKQGYGEDDKMFCDEEKMMKSEFYQRFIKYYHGENLTAQDILAYEKWLLKQRKLRILKYSTYENEIEE